MYIVSTGRHHVVHHGSTILHFLFATRIVPKVPRAPTGKRRIGAVPRLTAGDTPGYIMMHLCAREATTLTRKLSFFQNYENNLESHSIPRLINPISVGVSAWDYDTLGRPNSLCGKPADRVSCLTTSGFALCWKTLHFLRKRVFPGTLRSTGGGCTDSGSPLRNSVKGCAFRPGSFSLWGGCLGD